MLCVGMCYGFFFMLVVVVVVLSVVLPRLSLPYMQGYDQLGRRGRAKKKEKRVGSTFGEDARVASAI